MRKIVTLLLLGVILTFVGCGSTEVIEESGNARTENTEVKDKDVNEPENKKDVITDVTEKMVREYKVAPASDFEYEDTVGGVIITEYLGDDVIVVIPEEIDGKPVVELKALLFANDYHPTVKGVMIPTTVKQLVRTFTNNEEIQVVITEGVEGLLDSTFLNCDVLHTLLLGNNLNEVEQFCISSCPKLEEVYIPSTLTNVDEDFSLTIFFGCKELTVYGEAGSYVETLCSQNNIPFEAK